MKQNNEPILLYSDRLVELTWDQQYSNQTNLFELTTKFNLQFPDRFEELKVITIKKFLDATFH